MNRITRNNLICAGVILLALVIIGLWMLWPTAAPVLFSKSEQIHVGMAKADAMKLMHDVKPPILVEAQPVPEQGYRLQQRMVWDDGHNQYVVIFGTDDKVISATLGNSGEPPFLGRVLNWFGR
ncbi:MAG: hypothetical protein QM703_11930 [Gemmatales bacterium]